MEGGELFPKLDWILCHGLYCIEISSKIQIVEEMNQKIQTYILLTPQSWHLVCCIETYRLSDMFAEARTTQGGRPGEEFKMFWFVTTDGFVKS